MSDLLFSWFTTYFRLFISIPSRKLIACGGKTKFYFLENFTTHFILLWRIYYLHLMKVILPDCFPSTYKDPPVESAKSRAWSACVVACFTYSCAWVLTCLRVWLDYVLACLTYLRVCALIILACFISLRAHMSYILFVLKDLVCLCTAVLGVLTCPICFTFEKLNTKNSCLENFVFLQGSI